MQILFEHKKRPTVPNTLHGTINQITKAMFHAFINTYISESDFYIVTEDTAFGDFDDLVLVTSEGKVTAIQYKHVKKVTAETEISTNDIITAGGNGKELMFYKYYHSLITQRPQWENEPNLTLELASNSPIDQTLSACIDPNTKQFYEKFFTGETKFPALILKIIIASILKHNNKLNFDDPTDRTPYLNYLDLLLLNYKVNENLLEKLFQALKPRGKKCQNDNEKIKVIKEVVKSLRDSKKNSEKEWEKLSKLFREAIIPYSGITHFDVIRTSVCAEEEKVIKFLKKLKFSHSEPSKNQTILDIKNKLSTQFSLGKDATDILYNTFFYCFTKWLASESATHISNADIKNKFLEWQSQLQLQQWIGISSAYQKSLVTTIDEHQFNRDALIAPLNNFKESENRGLVIFGDRGIGKSTLICQYIGLVKKLDSDCLMLDINTIIKSFSSVEPINRCSFDFFQACQIIAIENCEDAINYPQELIKLFERLLSKSPKNIKFIFSFRANNFKLEEKLFGISTDFIELLEMPKLDKKNVIEFFPFIFKLSEPNKQVTLYQKPQPNVLLDNLICHPFYLNLLVMYHKRNGTLTVTFSSKDDFINEVLESLLTTSQLSVVRRLVYLISQSKETRILATSANKNDLKALINQGIVIEKEGDYGFSHKLYEEWALRVVIEMRLKCMIESNDNITLIYQDIMRSLPSNQKEIFIYLGESTALREHRRLFSPITFDQEFIENNNISFLKNSIENRNYDFVQNTSILYVLVDSAPEALLLQLLEMTNVFRFRTWLSDANFSQDFYTVLIRSFCISKNMILAGTLFYQTLKKLDQFGLDKGFDSLYYMEKFFENAFAASQSPGLMCLKEKLHFLNFHCVSISSNSTVEKQCYFQYIYQGLLNAAYPSATGDALFAESRCYFVSGRGVNDGYVNYKGEYFGFCSNTTEACADYNCKAVRILVDFYNRKQKLELIHLNPLEDIIEIFESSLAAVSINPGTHSLDVVNVASIIAAEISLSDELLEILNSHISDKYKYIDNKFQENTTVNKESPVNAMFDPHQTYQLEKDHLSQIKVILQWRKENQYQTYQVEDIQPLLSQISIAAKTNTAKML